MKLYLILFLIFISIFNIPVQGFNRDSKSWLNLSADSLYRKGAALYNEKPDSALLYLSLVESRYNPSMNKEEQKLCVQALLQKFGIYYYKYYDFVNGYESLLKAEEICKEGGLINPTVDLHLGIIYQTIEEETGDKRCADLALFHYKRAFENAIKSGETENIHIIFANLTQHSFNIDRLDEIENIWQSFQDINVINDKFEFDYNKKMYEALKLLKNKNYTESYTILDSLYNLLPYNSRFIRYHIISNINRANALMQTNNFSKAYFILDSTLNFSIRNNVKDGEIEIYKLLSICKNRMRDTIGSLEFENRGLRLRDSILSFTQLSQMKDLKINKNIDEFKNQIREVQIQRKYDQIIIICIIVLMVVTIIFLYIVFNKNKKLKGSNKELYLRYNDILNQNNELSELRKEYEKILNEKNSVQSSPDMTISEENKSIKYRNSSLDEKTKLELINKILTVMENNDEYFSPDFNIERLAELCDSKPKLVSQVINEKKGCNFNCFVNEFRINEACRRIKDSDNYGFLTLDAIAKSVGFRARSSFFNAFKSVVGLTPSQFQKNSIAVAKS